MPTFKDFVAADIGTFLNPEEFGEMHDVNGTGMLVVIDNDLLKDRPRQPAEAYYATSGVYVAEKVIFIRESDLGYTPVIGQRLTLDGHLYLVADCNSQMGVLEITLAANES